MAPHTPKRLLAVCLLVSALPLLASAAPSSQPKWWIVGGGGIAWPPAELGIEESRPSVGLIVAPTFAPPWALEARGHYAWSDSFETKLTHVEANLSLFGWSESWFSPYLTGGAGMIWVDTRGASESKFGWNGGAGFRIRLSRTWAFRTDIRDVSYQVPDASNDDSFRHSAEWFAGLQYGFGSAAPDVDGDGVPNKTDACPDTPMGARVDVKGCPLDGDGDGVPDGLDQCEGTPKGATVDIKGCPSDADADGVFDGLDTCPSTPKGARVDVSGCPLDSDGDGVFDGLDQCEGTPKGCTVNPNGCPSDADQDGICDGLDRCPDTPATARVDAKGCPIIVSEKETEMLETGMIRLQNVNFDTGKATIKEESYPVLDEVGTILLKWPELRIEIGGHTDSRGSDAFNQKLSEERAQSVLAYVTQKFPDLKADQFTAVGYGESKPLVPNTSALNMAKNRRVEFKVLNDEILKREREKQRVLEKE
jgi:outer membrane protein OmpA-like peptidoglycan-associated protein